MPMDPGQIIKVTGSRLTIGGRPSMIAAYVRMEDMVTPSRNVKSDKSLRA